MDTSDFTSSIDALEENILEDEFLLVTVTTTANNPEFIWYLNDTIIPSAISSSYDVRETGDYKVTVSQTTGCVISDEFLFKVITPFPDVSNIPNLISPNGDGINDTWIIPMEYVSGSNTEVLIISAQGKIELRTNEYQNNWPERDLEFTNVNPIYYYIITTSDGQSKKGTLTVVR